jgi:hypothetical protein
MSTQVGAAISGGGTTGGAAATAPPQSSPASSRPENFLRVFNKTKFHRKDAKNAKEWMGVSTPQSFSLRSLRLCGEPFLFLDN